MFSSKIYNCNLYLWLPCILLYSCFVSGCTHETLIENTGVYPKAEPGVVPAWFPEINYPEDNQPNSIRIALGKKFFYEKRFSADTSIACASCHLPELAFSDSVAISKGSYGRLGTRNAPSLGNVAWQPYLMREGGVSTIEKQALAPFGEHNEFDLNIVDALPRIIADTTYQNLSQQAYQRPLEYYVITRALAAFERSFITAGSPFDDYFYRKIPNALSSDAIAGLNLFFSDSLACSKCHSGFDFTNYSFQNNGLYITYADSGRARLTYLPQDRALFKVPSLRNIALTATYMHNGSIKTLNEVIDHYASGGLPHENKSSLLKGFVITDQQKAQLIAFLQTLTDTQFINYAAYRE